MIHSRSNDLFDSMILFIIIKKFLDSNDICQVSLHGSHKGCAGTLIESARTNQSIVVTSACCIPDDLIHISKVSQLFKKNDNLKFTAFSLVVRANEP